MAGGDLSNLEYRAVVVRTADLCRAKQVAAGVGDQAAVRRIACGVAEVDQGVGGAGVACGGLRDLERRAIIPAPAPLCRAEQVSVGIDDQAAERSVTVGVIEADQGRETVIAASPHRRLNVCQSGHRAGGTVKAEK